MSASERKFGDMRQQGLLLADLDRFPSLVESANGFLRARLQQLYDLLITGRGAHYYRVEPAPSAATVVDQHLYTWADFGIDDFYRLLDLHVDNGDQYSSIPTMEDHMLAQLREYQASNGVWNVGQYRRALRPTGIEIRPAPQTTSHTLTLYYLPSMPDPLVDGAYDDEWTFDGINGWERWAEIGLAVDLRNKEGEDATPLRAELAVLEQRIINLASSRDQGRPPTIKMVRRGWRRPMRLWRDREEW